MDHFKRLCVLVGLAALVSCASPGPVVRDLGTRGLTERSTAKLVFAEAAGEAGGRLRVVVTETGVTRSVWNSLRSAKASEAQRLAHPRTLEIYDSIQAKTPSAVFLVEGDQITPADQPQTGAYRAPGLYDMMGIYLQNERERLRRLNPVTPTAP